jgi:hypothetical protein
MHKNGTLCLMLIPLNKRPITTKWVFKLKVEANSRFDKHKSRLVAQVYEKQHDIDFHETFALVIKWGLIISMISIAIHHGWGVHQLNIKTTF